MHNIHHLHPKFSIITVTYNAGAVLEDTIQSVITQTYKNVEYIIVDGGSKDRTLQIVEQYKEHIHTVISEPDKGLYDAMNKGIKLATYASRCIGNEILMYLRKTSNRRQEASLDEPLNVDGDGNELLLSDILGSDANAVSQQLEQDAERAGLRRAVSSLSARERRIMELRFGLTDGVERTQKEAADALGISQSYISRLEKRIIQTLKLQLEGQ